MLTVFGCFTAVAEATYSTKYRMSNILEQTDLINLLLLGDGGGAITRSRTYGSNLEDENVRTKVKELE